MKLGLSQNTARSEDAMNPESLSLNVDAISSDVPEALATCPSSIGSSQASRWSQEASAEELRRWSHQLRPRGAVASTPKEGKGAGTLPYVIPTQCKLGDHLATMIVNGMYMVQVELGESVTAPVSPALRLSGENNGLYVHLVMCYPFGLPSDEVYKVDAIFRTGVKEKKVLMGYLTCKTRQAMGADYLPFLPTKVEIVTQRVDKEGDINEEKFTEGVVAILKNETTKTGCGSLPSALIQNQAKCMPLYAKVVADKYGGSWHQYLHSNNATFTVFQLGEEEIAQHQVAPYIKPNEVRVALTSLEFASVIDSDRIRARKHARHEDALIRRLEELLNGKVGGLDQREVMDNLARNEDFLHFTSPSFSTLLRFLVQHKDKFAWTSHPALLTTVGLAKGAKKGEISDCPVSRRPEPKQGTRRKGSGKSQAQ